MGMRTSALARVEAARHRVGVLQVYSSFGDSLHKKVKRCVIRKALRIRISYPVAKGWARSRVMLNIGEEKA